MASLPLVYLKDYQAPAFKTVEQDLNFSIFDDRVILEHKQQFIKQTPTDSLVLDGEDLNLLSIAIDDKPLDKKDYRYQNNKLTINNVGDNFVLTTKILINPARNKQLSGLYLSNGIYCTQCEAQGFRRISFAQDRPDVLSVYKVRIEADKKHPVLLSNGDLIEKGEVDGNRHFAVWFDPHPKPSYLFAIVVGDLAKKSTTIYDGQNKKITLNIFTEPKFIHQTEFALQSLIDSIKWDEQRFKLFYDLSQFNIVAVSDFNMGAMENKSLNIFNTKYVLADTDTATDFDFENVRAVIGHEYFHNWTGNRVTCRDWFQLSLKEGLTVFREQEFLADLGERSLQRINQVNDLRKIQFSEDASPMRHSVQPESYAAIDNFYTPTVYEKGAEIVRMYHSILGETDFQQGMQNYFHDFDGKAATVNDFAKSMTLENGFDFTKDFFNWYKTAGTPKVSFILYHNKSENSITFTARQDISAVSPERPLVIPIRFSLMNKKGDLYSFDNGQVDKLLILDKKSHSWKFKNINDLTIPVLMQGFSAPVFYSYEYTIDELSALILHAPDGFVRYEAMQQYYQLLFNQSLDNQNQVKELLNGLVFLLKQIFAHPNFSPAEKALLLTFPNLLLLIQKIPAPWDLQALDQVYEKIQQMLAFKLKRELEDALKKYNKPLDPQFSAENVGIRQLKKICLIYLSYFNDQKMREYFFDYYRIANNMTEKMSALYALNKKKDIHQENALKRFYRSYQQYPLVIDKWFLLQASNQDDDAFEDIKKLANHPDFNPENPNRMRALVFGFTQNNIRYFHQENGAGYAFVAELLKRVIYSNPQIAAFIVKQFGVATKLDVTRKRIIKKLLLEILLMTNISVDVREVIVRITDELND